MDHALLSHLGLAVGPAPRVREAVPHPHHDSPPAVVAGTAVGTAPAGEA
jgi:hypothetical protein